MKNENKYVYYGILFYTFYLQIYFVVSEVFFLPVLIFRWNIHFIPLFLLLLVAILSITFYRIKNIPILNVWFILFISFLSSVIYTFTLKYRFYLLDRDPLYDSPEILPTITNYLSECNSFNIFLFLCISYYKYIKTKKNNWLQSHIDGVE